MAKSDYLENKVLDHVLGTAAFTSPSQAYLALYTSNPTDADTGTEVSGGSYARQAVDFDAASGGATSNSAIVTFTDMPAATITHFGIRDAATGGNLLYSGALTTSKTTNAGDTFEVPAGDLDVTEN